MPLVITINALPGPANDLPIGLSAALSEAGGFAGATSVTWELTRPPGSTAVLATVGPIGAAPFTNSFTPDVTGNYRVRLLATYADLSIVEATAVARVLDPYVLETPGALPAPLEALESDGAIGWADEANQMLRAGRLHLGPTEWVTVVNQGPAIPALSVVTLRQLSRWAEETGGGTGAQVAGAPVDWISEAWPNAFGGVPVWDNLAFAPEAIDAGARGRVARRGLVVCDSLGMGAAGTRLYLNDAGALTLDTGKRCVLIVISPALATANPPGRVLFDPYLAERIQPEWEGSYVPSQIVLADNQAVAVDVDSRLTWDTAAAHPVYGAVVDYCVYRGGRVEIGTLLIAIKTAPVQECIVTRLSGTTTLSPGITFVGAMTGNIASVQYTSTALGVFATFKFTVRKAVTL